MSLPNGRLSCVLCKYSFINNITLFRNGRVLVVRYLADWRVTFQLTWNVQNADVSERATPAFFQRSLSLLIRGVLISIFAQEESRDVGISLRDRDLRERGSLSGKVFPSGERTTCHADLSAGSPRVRERSVGRHLAR